MSSTENDGRVTLADGRWFRLRPMSGNDLIALSRADSDLESTLGRLKAAVVDQSWEGDLLDLPWADLRRASREWRKASEDAALPPARGER